MSNKTTKKKWHTHQLAKEVGDAAIWNICQQGVKNKTPDHRIQQSLFELIYFEMLISDPLLVDADPFDCKDSIFWGQPSRIQLVVRNQVEKVESNTDSEQASCQKNDLPWLN